MNVNVTNMNLLTYVCMFQFACTESLHCMRLKRSNAPGKAQELQQWTEAKRSTRTPHSRARHRRLLQPSSPCAPLLAPPTTGTEPHATTRRRSELLPVKTFRRTQRGKKTQKSYSSNQDLNILCKKKSSTGSHAIHNDSNILCLGFMLWEMSFTTFSSVDFHVNALASCFTLLLWKFLSLLSVITINSVVGFYGDFQVFWFLAYALWDSRQGCQVGECRACFKAGQSYIQRGIFEGFRSIKLLIILVSVTVHAILSSEVLPWCTLCPAQAHMMLLCARCPVRLL